jgi:hypothetical protein
MATSRRDRRIPLVGLSHLARDREPAVDIADFKHLVPAEHPGIFPMP